MSREIKGIIEAKQNVSAKENASLSHRAARLAERNATHEKQFAPQAVKDQKAKEALVLAR